VLSSNLFHDSLRIGKISGLFRKSRARNKFQIHNLRGKDHAFTGKACGNRDLDHGFQVFADGFVSSLPGIESPIVGFLSAPMGKTILPIGIVSAPMVFASLPTDLGLRPWYLFLPEQHRNCGQRI
jgi:hypothetical protein